MQNIENLSDKDRSRWEKVCEGLSLVLAEVFGEETDYEVVLGAKIGAMGQPNQPVCMISGTLEVCQAVEMVADMLEHVAESHQILHEEMSKRLPVLMDALSVPQEIRDAAKAYAEANGLPFTEETIKYVEMVDVADLQALPETEEPDRG